MKPVDKHHSPYGRRVAAISPVRCVALLLAIALFTALPLLPAPAVAESSPRLAWLDRALELAATCDLPLDCDGSLWRAWHGASEDAYYDMLLRKSEDANWDLFTSAGCCTEMDDTLLGEAIYHYLNFQPYIGIIEEAHGYAPFDFSRLYVHPLDDSRQLLFVLLTEYYFSSPEDAPVREQSFEEFAMPLISGDVRLLDCEPYDWVTNGYEFGAVNSLIYTEADDYYLFQCTPEDGGRPIRLLIRDYAYYDEWDPMSSREEIEGPTVQANIYGSGHILTTRIDVRFQSSKQFKVDVAYDNAREEGSIDAIITVDFDRGDAENPVDSIENVQLALDGLYGFVPSKTKIALGTLTGPVTQTVRYDYHDPDGLIHPSRQTRPTVLISVTGNDAKTYEYSIEMDVQPQARFLSLCAAGDDLIETAFDTVNDVYGGRAYDGREIVCSRKMVDSRTTYVDDDDGLGQLERHETDDNDITYIYFASHSDSGVDPDNPPIAMQKRDQTHYTYPELLDYINTHVRGRVILMFDLCFSGQAIEVAQSLSLDPKRYFLVSSTTSDHYAPESLTGRGMKVARIVKTASDKTKDWAECSILHDILNGFSEALEVNANTLLNKILDKIYGPGTLIWRLNEPQFYGNERLPLIFNDPDFDDHYRLPVPLEETVKPSETKE